MMMMMMTTMITTSSSSSAEYNGAIKQTMLYDLEFGDGHQFKEKDANEEHYQLSFSDGAAMLHLAKGGEAHGSSPFTSTPRGIVIEGDLLLFDDDKVSVCLIWCLEKGSDCLLPPI